MSDAAELILDGGAPVTEQIEGQVFRLVLGGALRPGAELPTVRAVAVGLAVNPHAVAQAYDRLERAGLVTRDGGAAPRVAGPPADAGLKQLCADFLRAMAVRGHAPAAVLDALQSYLLEEVSH